jgi:hypothetical protein
MPKKLKPPHPNWDLYEHGISQSMLAKFVTCRERFRVYAVEGLSPTDRKEAMEFGTIFHKALEYAAQKMTTSQIISALLRWGKKSNLDVELCRIAAIVIPHYTKFWKKDRYKYVSQEEVFEVPHRIRLNGKMVKLRGRWDEVYELKGNLWLQENKTKSRIDEDKLLTTLPWDLQTMLYCYTLQLKTGRKVDGFLYNVIRKPGLKQHVKETDLAFLNRINDDIASQPDHYFKRYEIELSPDDIKNFVHQTLDPLLDQVAVWWESIRLNPFNPWVGGDGKPNPHHWTRPFGIFDPMSFGKGDYFEFITTGNRSGLAPIESPFPELVGEQGSSNRKGSKI